MADADLLEGADEELGNGGPQERDWKGIGTALLVIMFICSLIALAVFLFTPMTANVGPSKMTLNVSTMGLVRSPITNAYFHGKDIIYEYVAMRKEIMKRLNLDTMEAETIFDQELLEEQAKEKCDDNQMEWCKLEHFLAGYGREEASHDLRYFSLSRKLTAEEERQFNATSPRVIFDRETSLIYKVGVAKTDDESQRFLIWNPVGNDYVFWQDGNLFYSNSVESAESLQITTSNPNLIHGIFDWMYKEEIYDRNDVAVFWSQKGEKLAFHSRVLNPKEKSVYMTSYTAGNIYPTTVELTYPKTHEKILPTYIINIWDKRTRVLKQMDIQLRDSTAFHYIFRAKWVVMDDKEYLVVTFAERLQTHISITICDHESGMCKLVYEHKYPHKMYAEPGDFDSLYSNDSLYILLPRAKNDGNSYQHIAKLIVKGPTGIQTAKEAFLSIGKFDVKNLVAYDRTTDTVYFHAMAPTPTNLHLYSTPGSPTTNDAWKCLTCKFPNCTYQETKVQSSFEHILIHCKGPTHHHFYLADIVKGEAENWQEILYSQEYEDNVGSVRLPYVISEVVPLGEGFEGIVRIVLPPDQPSRSSARSIPVMLKVYAGPGGPLQASDEFVGFEDFMGTSHGYAVVSVDGRGTTGRGWKYRSAFYGAMGTVEIDDQIEGVRQVLKRYTFLDSHRVVVFGWSYGGYASALIAERAPQGFFKCAIAVAPVSNFLYYDATYTERYMGNADDSVYNANDISRNVENFRKTRLLLMHGLYDENVHFQHSALFMSTLQEKNVDFELMVYPNMGHGIVDRRQHLYMKFGSFLDQCAKV